MLYQVVDWMSGAIFAVPLAWLFLAVCGKRSVKSFLLTGVFTVYLCEVFNVVGIPAASYFTWSPTVNLIPFGDEKNSRFFFQLGMNAVMFLPLGALLPVLWCKCRNWKAATLTGFFTSAGIELLQLFSFRVTDVDDLVMNTLGTFLGYLLAWAFLRKTWRQAPGIWRVNEWFSLTVSVLIPLLVTVFLRTPVSGWVYSLPLFG